MPLAGVSSLKPVLAGSQLDAETLKDFVDLHSVGGVDEDAELMSLDLDAASFFGYFGTSRASLVVRTAEILSAVEIDPSVKGATRGFLGLIRLTAISLENAGQPSTEPFHDVLRELVLNPDVRDTLIRFYNPVQFPEETEGELDKENRRRAEEYWKGLDPSTLQLHRIGTTSVILTCRVRAIPGQVVALKVLLFPYRRIDPVYNATRRYAVDYGAGTNPWIVPVYASCPGWIMMEFVDGPTLREELDQRSTQGYKTEGVNTLQLNLLKDYGLQLFQAIDSLAKSGRAHEDLTPSNIVLRNLPDGGRSVVLIDLGRNYLYTRLIGVHGNVEAKFVAPEVRDDKVSSNADIYSAGMLTAELLDPGSALDGKVPTSLYAYAPVLARIVEDLVDARPRNRMLLFGASGLDVVRTAIREEIAILTRQAESQNILGRPRPLLELLRPSSREVSAKFREWRQTRKSLIDSRQPIGYLLGWSVVSSANWAIAFTVCFLWGLRDLGLDNWNLPITILQKLAGTGDQLPVIDTFRAPDYQIHDWKVNLMARLVGFTTALAQTRYYQNIFSRVYAYRLPGGLAKVAEVSTRLVTICTLIPVLLGNLVQPRWTLMLLAAGMVFIAFHNLVFYLLLSSIFRQSRGVFSTLPDDNAALRAFSQWWSTQLIYAVVIAATAVGLQLGILRDAYAYVFLVCVVNVFVFYVSKCTVLAPTMRALLARGCIAGERLPLAAAGA